MADSAGKLILMAVIGKAQGLRGQMRLKIFAENAESLAAYPALYDKTGKRYAVESLRFHGKQPVLALKGVESRSAAELLAGLELFVPRSALPKPDEDEFYQEDLLERRVFDTEGELIGSVSGFFNFGGGDLLEVTLGGAAKGRKELIPFSKAAVPQIESGRLVINRLAAGLADSADSGDAQKAAKSKAKSGL